MKSIFSALLLIGFTALSNASFANDVAPIKVVELRVYEYAPRVELTAPAYVADAIKAEKVNDTIKCLFVPNVLRLANSTRGSPADEATANVSLSKGESTLAIHGTARYRRARDGLNCSLRHI